MAEFNAGLKDKLAVLKANFATKLPAKINAIDDAVQNITDADDPDKRRAAFADLQSMAHKLAGSAGTYGLMTIGHTARNLELLCVAIGTRGDFPDDAEIREIRDLVELLRHGETQASGSALAQEGAAPDVLPMPSKIIPAEQKKKLILVDDDEDQASILAQRLGNFGYAVHTLGDPSTLGQLIKDVSPDAVIMDIVFPDGNDEGLSVVNQLREHGNLTCPVIFISARNDFSTRLKAIRCGADGFIAKPIHIIELVDALDNLINADDRPPFRILVVDDDPDMTAFCATVLERDGHIVSVLNDPASAAESIVNFEPDAVILDIAMPYCSGFELAKVIRQINDRMLQLPIMFLSAHSEIENRQKAAWAGAEDFISKPVDAEHLSITVRARVERARILRALFDRLRAGEERFNSITESANEAIVSVNEHGLIVSWNPSAELIFGYMATEVLGRSITMLIPEELREAHIAGFQRAITSGLTMSGTTELIALRKDGSSFPMDLSLSSWRDQDRMLFAASVRDISMRKEHEAALHRAMSQTKKANMAKSEFLSSMSHELRTPMNAIMGFAQLLQFNPKEKLTARQDDSVAQILSAGEHLLELISDLLDLSRIEAGKVDLSPETVEVVTILDTCVKLLTELATARNIEIAISVDADSKLTVFADERRLKQVLLNLLSNAIKYNNEGGSVVIDCHNTPQHMARFSITDTGNGISQANQKYLFQPFSRLGAEISKTEGTGIGLVVCKDLIELMNGSIGCTSIVGQGTTFWFELPVADSTDAAL